MTTPQTPHVERSYGCTFGCGNPYDFVLVTVADGTVEMLCMPCMVKLAADMISAITDPENADVLAAIEAVASDMTGQVPGPSGRPRGRNAPATSLDPDVFESFDSTITVEQLSDEFR